MESPFLSAGFDCFNKKSLQDFMSQDNTPQQEFVRGTDLVGGIGLFSLHGGWNQRLAKTAAHCWGGGDNEAEKRDDQRPKLSHLIASPQISVNGDAACGCSLQLQTMFRVEKGKKRRVNRRSFTQKRLHFTAAPIRAPTRLLNTKSIRPRSF